MAKNEYHLTLYGATGFTGRQAARYLGRHPDRSQFRFAVAGRSRDRLAAIADEVSADGFVVADGLDPAAVDAMVDQTRVVATTAGPFALYGDELVRSCAERGVHYADITGETPWVRTVIDRFHETAEGSGARIVPFCGYDSVPSDLGTWFVVDRLRREHGEACREVTAFHRARGGVNGGTLASMLELQKAGKGAELANPRLLDPAGQREPEEAEPEEGRDRDPILPYFEPRLGVWAAPFFMGQINTRVVRRSHALLGRLPAADSESAREDLGEGYGPDFRYQEYWQAKGLFGWAEAGALSSFQMLGNAFARSPSLGAIAQRFLPSPGTGPSETTMDRGFFVCDLLARSAVGARTIRARLSGDGDPGNRITVKCLCESALALALDQEALPPVPGGILTPATALAGALVERLRSAGIQFENV